MSGKIYETLAKYHLNSLKSILLLSLIINLIAALFAHGFYAYDDYFKVVEISWDWTRGLDTDNWFVDNYTENEQLREILYPGVIAGILSLAGFFTKNPFYQMIFVQVFHAIYAVLIPFLVYKITLSRSDEKHALIAGLLSSIMWFFPFMAARTLAEWVSIPPILGAFYFYYRTDCTERKQHIWIGLLLGIAFYIRFQSAFIISGFYLATLIRKEYKILFYSSAIFLIFTVIFQGVGDYFICNMPFGKLIEYVEYNINNSGNYITRPVFDYIILIPVLFLPPFGLLLFIASFLNPKKNLHLFLSMLIFLVVHSVFENKQERFIFTILPFYLILGVLNWYQIKSWNLFSQRPKLLSGFVITFLVFNSILLPLMTLNYTKKSKIELLRFLRENPKTSELIIENKNTEDHGALPMYYAGRRIPVFSVNQNSALDRQDLDSVMSRSSHLIFEIKPEEIFNNQRLAYFESPKFKLNYLKRIEGSLIDNFRFKLNPVVKNYEYEVYEIEPIR